MTALAWLIPCALLLGLLGLAAFLWSLGSGQFEDLEGAAWRALQDDEATAHRLAVGSSRTRSRKACHVACPIRGNANTNPTNSVAIPSAMKPAIRAAHNAIGFGLATAAQARSNRRHRIQAPRHQQRHRNG